MSSRENNRSSSANASDQTHTMKDSLQTILAKLSGVKKSSSTSYTAKCPAHEDNRASLSIAQQSDRVLLYCHAGCTIEEVCRGLGCSVSDLFENPGNTSVGSLRAEKPVTYIYEAEDGKATYRVVRMPGKSFKQIRIMPDGAECAKLAAGWYRKVNGEWKYFGNERSLQPSSDASWFEAVKPVPFQLPLLLQAVEHQQDIYITEGEKDAINLSRLGVFATTNSGGAGKWKPEFSGFLIGSKVKIIADNDKPGIAHAEGIAESLRELGIEHQILLARHGKDASDHIAGGYRLQDFVPYSPCTRPSLIVPMSEIEPETVEWLWEGYIPLGAVTLLGGDPGKGKTRTALSIAAAISRGEVLPGNDRPLEGNILVVTLEEPAGQIRKRLDDLGADLSRIHIVLPDKEFKSAPLEWFRNNFDDKDFCFIIFDPLQCFVSPKADMQTANKSRFEMDQFIELASSSGAAVMIICHPNKQEGTTLIYRFNGSLDIVAAARSALYLGDHEEGIALSQVKSNLGPMARPIEVIMSDSGCVSFGELLEQAERQKGAVEIAADFILAQLEGGPMLSEELNELAKLMGISKTSSERARKKLGTKIKARKRSDGKWELLLAAALPEDLPSE